MNNCMTALTHIDPVKKFYLPKVKPGIVSPLIPGLIECSGITFPNLINAYIVNCQQLLVV